MPELDGKVAIVTGAGRLRGIGRGAAVAFAKLGADVVVTGTGRDPSRYPDDEKAVGWRDIESTAEQVRALGVRALPLLVDVTNEDEVQMMVDRTLEELGRVDFLVNNAAWARGPDRVSFLDLDPDILQSVLDVKINGGFYCSRAVTKVLLQQGEGGAIVFVSSGAGKIGGPNAMAYVAACFAQVGMTQSLAAELGPHGINVNCVCPGAVDTSRVDDVGRGDGWEAIIARTPLRRVGTDDELGGIIAYLCTEGASFLQGQSINVNGGTMMAP